MHRPGFYLSILLILLNSICIAQEFVTQNGKLKVVKTQLCNQQGKPIQLKGFSTHNTTYHPECVTYDAIKSNRDFWGVNVVRVTVYTDDHWNPNTYSKNPAFSKAMVDSVVNWSEQLGIYCIIDWHILTKGNPNDPMHADAPNFFEEVAKKYAQKKHVLYELCNEPNGDDVTWDTIARYANRILPIIRNHDKDAVIIIGTPRWCQELDKVDVSKLNDIHNVMYAFHFYAATHQSLLPLFEREIHRIPVMVTEWGVCENTGNGKIDLESSEKYIAAMKHHSNNNETVSVSWCLFSFGDKKESSSVLEPGSCHAKQWENMSPTGYFIRKHFK